jgi:hypothetical protein
MSKRLEYLSGNAVCKLNVQLTLCANNNVFQTHLRPSWDSMRNTNKGKYWLLNTNIEYSCITMFVMTNNVYSK